MDLVTHVLISYLLNWRVADFGDPWLFIFGIICGMFPDFDVFLSPLAHRFPWAGHHGATHSLIGGAVLGVSLAAVAYIVWGLPFLPAVAVAVPTIFVHILCDGLTNWAVPLGWPLTDRPYKFDIDWAVNPFLIATSSGSILFWWYLHTISFPLPLFHLLLLGTGLAYAAYFAARAAGKLLLLHKMGREAMVAPTISPRRWNVALRHKAGTRYEIMIGELKLLSGAPAKMMHAHFSFVPVSPPLNTQDDVAGYTYNLPEVQRFLRRFRVPLFAVVRRPSTGAVAGAAPSAECSGPREDNGGPSGRPAGPEGRGMLGKFLRIGGSERHGMHDQGSGEWKVVWFGAEFLFRRAVLGLMLEVYPDGKYTARTRFYGSLNGELRDGNIDLGRSGPAGHE